MNHFINKIVKKILPRKFHLPANYLYRYHSSPLDKEIVYAESLLLRKRRFLDIGCNSGIYTYHFKNIFDRIDSFEPIKEISNQLDSVVNDRITLHNIALSNKASTMPISIPKDTNGNLIIGEASLENKQGDCEIRKVPVKSWMHLVSLIEI